MYYICLCNFSLDAVIKIAALRFKIGSSSWWDQIVDVFYVNGKPDLTEAEALETRSDPSILDYVLHIATFPWKVCNILFCDPQLI